MRQSKEAARLCTRRMISSGFRLRLCCWDSIVIAIVQLRPLTGDMPMQVPLAQIFQAYKTVLPQHGINAAEDTFYYRLLISLSLRPESSWWAKLDAGRRGAEGCDQAALPGLESDSGNIQSPATQQSAKLDAERQRAEVCNQAALPRLENDSGNSQSPATQQSAKLAAERQRAEVCNQAALPRLENDSGNSQSPAQQQSAKLLAERQQAEGCNCAVLRCSEGSQSHSPPALQQLTESARQPDAGRRRVEGCNGAALPGLKSDRAKWGSPAARHHNCSASQQQRPAESSLGHCTEWRIGARYPPSRPQAFLPATPLTSPSPEDGQWSGEVKQPEPHHRQQPMPGHQLIAGPSACEDARHSQTRSAESAPLHSSQQGLWCEAAGTESPSNAPAGQVYRHDQYEHQPRHGQKYDRAKPGTEHWQAIADEFLESSTGQQAQHSSRVPPTQKAVQFNSAAIREGCNVQRPVSSGHSSSNPAGRQVSRRAELRRSLSGSLWESRAQPLRHGSQSVQSYAHEVTL